MATGQNNCVPKRSAIIDAIACPYLLAATPDSLLSEKSNEIELSGERLVIKCARMCLR